MINDKISWKPHLKYIGGKFREVFQFLLRLGYLNSKSLHALYCALVSPYINYCVWWPTNNGHNPHSRTMFILVCCVLRTVTSQTADVLWSDLWSLTLSFLLSLRCTRYGVLLIKTGIRRTKDTEVSSLRLCYNIEVWGNTYKSHLEFLFVF